MDEQQVKETLREIRAKLRLGMNGVTSTSMREKGMTYKLNFGVPFPEIRRLAASYQPDAALAEAMWKEDVRELKILATMLYPADQFTHEQAEAWIAEIPYLEIAESAGCHLYAQMPHAAGVAEHLLYDRRHAYARTVAFLTFMHLFASAAEIEPSHVNAFWCESIRTLTSERFGAGWQEQQSALKALKQYGRQSAEQARKVLLELDYLRNSDRPELQEIYNDLKFEFEYYF